MPRKHSYACLQFPDPPGVTALKTLVFCTSYHSTSEGWNDRHTIWIRALQNSRLRFDQLLIVDDASSVLPKWSNVEIITEAQQPRVECVQTEASIVLYTHTNRLGRASVFEFPGWYRSFAFGVLYGASHGFEKIIHIESDAFLISSRIQDHFNAFETGWFACWCEAYHFPEIAIQAAAGDEIAHMAAFVEKSYAQMEGQIHEFVFPFTHIECRFVGNRYGEMIGHVPRHADYSAQTHNGQPDAFYWWIPGNDVASCESVHVERVRAPFAADVLEGSWSGPEAGSNWMLEFDSILYTAPATRDVEHDLILELIPCLYQDRKQQRLFVLVNERLVNAVSLYGMATILCRLPQGCLSVKRRNQLRFLHPDAFAPAEIGPHPEKRRLSFALAGYEIRSRND